MEMTSKKMMLAAILMAADVVTSSTIGSGDFDSWSSVMAHSTLLFDLIDADRDWVISVKDRDDYVTNLGLNLYPWSLESMDSDEDGLIDRGEWRAWFTRMNVVLRLSFRILDKDKSGGITLEELQTATLKIPISSEFENVNLAFNSLLGLIDVSGRDQITLEEWLSSAAEGQEAVASLSFALMDTDSDGKMSLADLKNFLIDAYNGLGDGIPLSIIAAKFNIVDVDQDGLISLSEFEQWLKCAECSAASELFEKYGGDEGLALDGFRNAFVDLMEPGMRRIHAACDVDHDGLIDFDDFVDVALPLIG